MQRTVIHAARALVFLFVAVLAPAVPVRAQTTQPIPVEIGVWIDSIHTIDYVDGSFSAEFYLWWISPDPELRPFEDFQLLNGRDWTTRGVTRRVLPDGRAYCSGFVSATLNHHWELRKFPFDRQSLVIVLETPTPADELRLVPDTQGSALGDFLDVQGYEVLGMEISEQVVQYKTDFGLEEAAGGRYSRVVIALDVERESGRLLLALLIGFLAANVIALLTYAIQESLLGVRVAMVASAVFCAVGNMNLLSGRLNPAIGSLLVDRFAIGSFTAIVVALMNSIVLDRLLAAGRPRAARIVNRFMSCLVLLGSLAYYGLSLMEALS